MAALISRLVSRASPLAVAATPKAMPSGITKAASGAISTTPRQTPAALWRGM
ncbi:MAG TPA: hypothetical protein VFZ16_16380 [Hyphomicrobiaceae bacterium]|nr:hypothetical protein [Hyphomicrobiaceae bacterium]